MGGVGLCSREGREGYLGQEGKGEQRSIRLGQLGVVASRGTSSEGSWVDWAP